MIKILPSGTTARIEYGLRSRRRKSVKGRLGDGSREHKFVLPDASLKASWKDNALEAALSVDEASFITEVRLVFSFHSPRTLSDLVLWTDSAAANLPGGTLSVKKPREGAGALWISESAEAEGILFRQSPPAEYPVRFRSSPRRKSLEISWTLNRIFESGEALSLPTVRIARGERGRLIGTWRREWKNAGGRPPAKDRRFGWIDTGYASSPDLLREITGALKASRLPVDWYALGPGYSSATGDWLSPTDSFRDRMGNASRAVSEQSMIPGIRFAPFLVCRKSETAAEHRDWMVTNPGGSPVTVPSYNGDRDDCWVLDVSREDVRSHVKKIFAVMRDQWGFRAFILERLDDTAAVGLREQPARGPGWLHDSAAELCREALGNRVFIVSSGSPLQVSPGQWDARISAPPLRGIRGRKAVAAMQASASTMLHRAPWSEGNWSNATPPLPLDLFGSRKSAVMETLVNAAAISSGTSILSGDPRRLDDEILQSIRNYLKMFEECRPGRLRLSDNIGGGTVNPLVVRNDTGQIGLFNFSGSRKEVRLDREGLKTALGVASTLSAGDGAVFNSPEIHVALPPRGNRLFRG